MKNYFRIFNLQFGKVRLEFWPKKKKTHLFLFRLSYLRTRKRREKMKGISNSFYKLGRQLCSVNTLKYYMCLYIGKWTYLMLKKKSWKSRWALNNITNYLCNVWQTVKTRIFFLVNIFLHICPLYKNNQLRCIYFHLHMFALLRHKPILP